MYKNTTKLIKKLEEDLAFAAPELWLFHVERRLTYFLDNLYSEIEELPEPTLGLRGGVDRKAVLNLIKGE
jgi:hypothetical protein